MTQTIDRVAELAAGAALIGGADQTLTDAQVSGFIAEQLAGVDLDGRSVCLVIPDGTRSSPLPLLIDRAKRLAPMPFLDILRDLAPDGLAQAQTIAGTLPD